MARILYWNLLTFSSNLIDTQTNKRDRQDWEANAGPGGPARLAMIMNTLQAVDPATGLAAVLDFIVIVEVSPGSAAVEGGVVGGNGLQGCIGLYNALHAAYPNVWKMVPPIVTGVDGNAEAILIFYRQANWYFVGPEVAGVPYAANVLACMPARVLPVGPYVAAARNENTSAGKWRFFNGPPPVPPLVIPAQVLFPGAPQRKPWLAAFRHVGAAPQQLVRLMSIHTKPNDRNGGPNYADQATGNLATVYDMTTMPPLQANQIDVIVGDFNVNNLIAANFAAGGPFANLLGVGGAPVAPPYTALVRPGVMAPEQESYFHTLGKPANDADGNATIIEEDDGAYLLVGDYPGYEYSSLSLDNALVRYHPATPVPAAHHMTILARAQTEPYAVPAPPGPMLGYYQSDYRMSNSIVDIANLFAQHPGLANNEDPNQMFRDWDHYGRIRAVSDHFALLFDI